VADYLEFGELMCLDALTREESCGAHFRVEYQAKDAEGRDTGECQRNDKDFCHVAAWEYRGPDQEPARHVEPLNYETIQLAERSYK
jgi:succinate dehydrogenase / fumarate reductase flavoprotein subunit